MPDEILQVVHTLGPPTLQSDNLNYDDQEKSTFICPNNQITENIPNTTHLLETVDNNVSNGHILIVKNFLQRNDVVKLLQRLNLEYLATKAEMLAQLITSVKLIQPNLETTLDTALNDSLNNTHFDGTRSMKLDFMWVHQDGDEKIIKLQMETTVSIDTTTHSQKKNISREHTVQQKNLHTRDNIIDHITRDKYRHRSNTVQASSR